MSLTVAYGALLTAVLVWLFFVRKLTAKSWDAHAAISPEDAHAVGAEHTPPTKFGLIILITTSLHCGNLALKQSLKRGWMGRGCHQLSLDMARVG